ncbi:arginyl-tRNA synthetase [Microthyrium microscopicum]|uniref:arginine--tRNA ligase n=1 Tax=Microthyrium microscopicum TaxID=703497 RepID=A0A6A6UMW7_9PEZI|nr:arginyl-tRNA synthetase [Microthyrium microscopicum]
MDTKQLDHHQSLEDVTAILSAIGINEVPKQPNTYPELNPVDIYRSHITEILAPIAGVDKEIVFRGLQWATTLDNGDLLIATPALRIKGKKPDELAKELASKFPESPLVEPPKADKNFLKFFFKPLPLANIVLPSIIRNASSYGFNRNIGLKDPSDPSKGRKRVIVEFSSPNIAKPFHAGHLRSTIIGGFLSNIYEGAGWDVIRMNYLGDWGKQYGVLALGFEKFGSEEALQANPIGHLYDVYVKINAIFREEGEKYTAMEEDIKAKEVKGEDASAEKQQLAKEKEAGGDEAARKYFKRMVDGDKEALGLWARFRDLSIERYKQTYARLNISYDVYSGESQVKDESMDKAAQIMADTKVSENSEGAVIVDLTRWNKKLGKAVVKKKDGTSLYLTRDIGEIFQRDEKFHFDKMIYVVASQQDLHLAQLFKIVEVIGHKDIADKCRHINFGMVKGMSTRKGTVKFLDDILRDVGDKMHEVMRVNDDKYKQVEDPVKTADTLGISAVMVQDMTGKRVNGYDFDMDRMCSFEGDTGPYLQYAHARLSSIIRKVSTEASPDQLIKADWTLLKEKHAVDLIRALAQWPDVFLNTLKTEEPITTLTYLFKMTHALSSSYDHLQVVGSAPELLKARMALYASARQVLSNGMRLLGLSPLDRM